jgi:hypothetical protein
MSVIRIDGNIFCCEEKKEKVDELIKSISNSRKRIEIIGMASRCPIINNKLKELWSKEKVKFVPSSSQSNNMPNNITFQCKFPQCETCNTIDAILKFLLFDKI